MRNKDFMGHKKFRGGALTREEKTTGPIARRNYNKVAWPPRLIEKTVAVDWLARVNRNHRGRVPKDPSSAQRPRNGPRPIYR